MELKPNASPRTTDQKQAAFSSHSQSFLIDDEGEVQIVVGASLNLSVAASPTSKCCHPMRQPDMVGLAVLTFYQVLQRIEANGQMERQSRLKIVNLTEAIAASRNLNQQTL